MDQIRCRHDVLAIAATALEHGRQVEIVQYPASRMGGTHVQVRVWDPEDRVWKYGKSFLGGVHYSSQPEYPPLVKENDANSPWKHFTFDEYLKAGMHVMPEVPQK